MGFANVQALADAELDGKVTYRTWRKTATQVSTIGVWFDLSMSPGNPVPQYYAATPLAAKALAQSTDGGIFHGGAVSPDRKYLRRCMAMTVTPTSAASPSTISS